MATCKNCNTEVDQKFCPNCGHPVVIKRIDGHYIIHEIEHVLHFDRGILYTIKELLLRPGESVKSFITENRNRLVKPIIFIIVTSLIYSLVNYFFKIEDAYMNFEGDESSTTVAIFSWIQGHYGYANIIMGIFIALWLKLFFIKQDYNLFEILILLCFVMGMGMLIYAIFAIIQGITKIDIMTTAGILGFVYCSWAIGQFFGKKKVMSYIKALFAYILGFLTFSIAAVGIGFLIDFIIKG